MQTLTMVLSRDSVLFRIGDMVKHEISLDCVDKTQYHSGPHKLTFCKSLPVTS
eukprot:UN01296